MARPAKELTPAEKAAKEKAKVDKFKELGTKRLNNALDSIAKLLPLANKSQYTCTEEQAKKIDAALSDAVKRVKDAFAGQKIVTGGVEL